MTGAYYRQQAARLELDFERTAWLAANIMNASGNLKHPVTVERLLGKKGSNPKQKQFESKEAREQELNRILARFEGRGE